MSCSISGIGWALDGMQSDSQLMHVMPYNVSVYHWLAAEFTQHMYHREILEQTKCLQRIDCLTVFKQLKQPIGHLLKECLCMWSKQPTAFTPHSVEVVLLKTNKLYHTVIISDGGLDVTAGRVLPYLSPVPSPSKSFSVRVILLPDTSSNKDESSLSNSKHVKDSSRRPAPTLLLLLCGLGFFHERTCSTQPPVPFFLLMLLHPFAKKKASFTKEKNAFLSHEHLVVCGEEKLQLSGPSFNDILSQFALG